MPPECPGCRLSFDREPGFYLGSIYVNYGLTCLVILVAYFVLTLVYRAPHGTKLAICVSIAVILPVLLFRHARSLWLGMDVFIDRRPDELSDRKP